MKKLAITFAVLLLITTSCGTTKGLEPMEILTGTTWQLTKINGNNVVAASYPRGLPYITFSKDNKVAGNGGCNGFGGSYNLNTEGGINMGQIMATKMFCEGSGENEFMEALNKANNTMIDSDKLVLLNGVDEVLTFAPKK